MWYDFYLYGIAAGIVLSVGAFALVHAVPADSFMSWGWRVPFLASVLALIVGIWIRIHVSESPVFTRPQSQKKVVWRESKREFMIAFGARMAENSSGFFLQVWALSYLTSQIKVSVAVGLTAVLLAAGLGMFPMFWIFAPRTAC